MLHGQKLFKSVMIWLDYRRRDAADVKAISVTGLDPEYTGHTHV